VPRPVRGAAQGGGQGPGRKTRRDPVHRRDPHAGRRRRDLRRIDGRQQLVEAGARQRRIALHRQHHVLGLQGLVRSRQGAGAPVPPRSVSADDKTALKSMAPELKRVVFGQDAAIESLASAILLSRSGLGNPTKPIGSFLFSGPTGVGKTELAKQLARIMGVPLIRFDMSEYMEKHTVSRLIGAPPGYVGFDQGGLLTDAIRKQPHAVLLLDEVEKANAEVFDILLQVM